MNAPDPAPRTTQYAIRITRYSLLVIILLLAAFLRLNHLSWTEFKQDEARLSQIAFDMARHGQIPLQSIGASVGVINLPLAAWLLAIPYAVSNSPVVATAFLALVNVLAVAACYVFARRCFGVLGNYSIVVALIAAWLFATAPWAVLQSRKLWANDFLPLFVIGWGWTAWLAFVERRPRWLIAHAVMLALCIQLHYSALLLAPVSAMWFIIFIRRSSWRSILVAAIVFAALFAPFLIADGSQGWPNVTRFIELFRQPATADSSAVEFSWLMTTGLDIHSLAGPQEFQNYRALVPFADYVSNAEGFLVLMGLIVALSDVLAAIIRRAWSDRASISLMLITWLSLPILSQISHRTPLFLHYFLILLPAPYLLIGLLAGRISVTRSLRVISIGVVIAIGLLQAYQSITLQQFVATRPTPGGAGIPIGYYESIANQAKAALQLNQAAEILINTRGSDRQTDEYPAIFGFLLNEVPHRFVDVTQSIRVYPQQPNIQIDYDPLASIGDLPARDQVAQIDLRVGEQPARVFKSNGYALPPCAATLSMRWANNTMLLSAKLDSFKAGQAASIQVCVRLDQNSPSTDYHWTNQLFDSAGKRWAQVDSAGFPARDWRSGDVVLLTFEIDLPADMPAGEYKLRIGQYTYPDIASVPVIDVMNNPQSDAIEIPVHITR
jgi:hypothetical protein